MSHNSPKSPPNSPTVELTDDMDFDLTDIYINREVPISDFIWDWSSRPNIDPPKQWRLQSSKSSSNNSCVVTLKDREDGRQEFRLHHRHHQHPPVAGWRWDRGVALQGKLARESDEDGDLSRIIVTRLLLSVRPSKHSHFSSRNIEQIENFLV